MNDTRTDAAQAELLKRRQFLTKAGGMGLAAAAAMMMPGKAEALISSRPSPENNIPNNTILDNKSGDTVAQILTAALIAEGLATTFYYNGLIGPVIQDPALAGPGGTATAVAAGGSRGNVGYLRGALYEEFVHANFLRAAVGLGTSPSADPVQTFYLPTGTFDTLASFTAVLNALESAFIGAYLAATLEFAQMACDSRAGGVRQLSASGAAYSSTQIEYFSQVAASILGVESEHRALGRVIAKAPPTANDLNYEQTDGVSTVYNGSASAVAALTPFLGPGAGMTGYSYRTALSGVATLGIRTTGNPPPVPPVRTDGQ